MAERSLLDRIRDQNIEIDAVADELIASRAPGWERLAIIRERDELRSELERLEARAVAAENEVQVLLEEKEALGSICDALQLQVRERGA